MLKHAITLLQLELQLIVGFVNSMPLGVGGERAIRWADWSLQTLDFRDFVLVFLATVLTDYLWLHRLFRRFFTRVQQPSDLRHRWLR